MTRPPDARPPRPWRQGRLLGENEQRRHPHVRRRGKQNARDRSATLRVVEASSEQQRARHTIELQGLTYPADVQLKEAGAAEQAVRLRAGPRALRLGPDARSATIAEEMIPEETGQLQVDIRPLPSTFALKKSRPNPATRRATIEYAVPEQSDVTVAVYDVLGRRVARLVDGPQPAGRHQARIDATRLPSGTYFVRMRAEDFTKTRRLTVTR